MIPNIPRSITVVQTEAQVSKAVSHLLCFDILGFDVETHHIYDRKVKAFDPTNGARMRLVQFATPEGDCFVFDMFKVSKTFLYMMFPNPYLCVGQNLKFDYKFLMYELGIDKFGETFDTFLAGQLCSKGAVAGPDQMLFSLADLCARELNVELPKDEQAGDWYKTELTDKQIEYAARDGLVVLPLFEKQRDKLKRDSQVRVAQVEFNAVPAVGDMELNGMRLDGEAWEKQYHAVEKNIEAVSQELWNTLGGNNPGLFEGIPTINLNSTAEVIKAFKRLKIPVPVNKKTGKESVDGKLLSQYELDYPLITQYKNYKGLSKQLSSYGLDWIDMINPLDGRIHANYKQIGAETGRMSANSPNLMQVPRENEYRNCLMAQDGWVIVGCDFSQCELRILAEYCRDENFLRAFDEGYDLHTYTASMIFKCSMETVTKKQRAIDKNLNFGIVYGIGVLKFAMDAGIPLEEAKKIMNFYLREAYPGMSAWLDRQARQVIQTMQSTTMTGRIRAYAGDLDADGVASQIERNGKNFPIQGLNADITKRALYFVFEAIRPYRSKMKLAHTIHDEILLEVEPSVVIEAQLLLEDCMLRAEREYLKRVPSKVDCSITLCWTKDPSKEQLLAAQNLIKEYN